MLATPHFLNGPVIPTHMHLALARLLQAYEMAASARCSASLFGVAIKSLRDAGLGRDDLLWLVRSNLVEHLFGATSRPKARRNLDAAELTRFTAQSLFVLTSQSRRQVGSIAGVRAIASLLEGNGQISVDLAALRQATPRWDAAIRELYLGPVLVRQFRRPARNQELMLVVFQEEGWPPHVDDPLTGDGHVNPVQRLHDAIADLNERQLHPLLRFHSDGNGRGVRWDRVRF